MWQEHVTGGCMSFVRRQVLQQDMPWVVCVCVRWCVCPGGVREMIRYGIEMEKEKESRRNSPVYGGVPWCAVERERENEREREPTHTNARMPFSLRP